MEAQLIGVLRATLDANTATVKAATEQLRAAGRAPGFASCLVKIMGEQGGVGEAHVKQSAAFTRGRFRWLVLVDDDSFVFAAHLRWVLSRLDASQPLYLGDFGSSTEAFGLHVPRFACGGGGSVLSAEAVRRMDLLGCIGRYHAQCMQSDWMIGGCARRHNASLVRELGCSTCDPKRIDRRAVAVAPA